MFFTWKWVKKKGTSLCWYVCYIPYREIHMSWIYLADALLNNALQRKQYWKMLNFFNKLDYRCFRGFSILKIGQRWSKHLPLNLKGSNTSGTTYSYVGWKRLYIYIYMWQCYLKTEQPTGKMHTKHLTIRKSHQKKWTNKNQQTKNGSADSGECLLAFTSAASLVDIDLAMLQPYRQLHVETVVLWEQT